MPSTYRIGRKPPPGKSDRRPYGIRWEGRRDPASGKRHQPSKQPFRTEREAIEWYERNIAGKLARATSRTPLADYLDRWIETLRLRPNTISAYRYAAASVSAHLGRVLLRDLSRADVRDWHDTLYAAGRAEKTVAVYHNVLVAALNAAVDRELLYANPAAGMKLPQGQPSDVHWTPAQSAAFLDRTVEDWRALPYQIMLLSGIRPGECLALRWADLDLERATLSVPDAKTKAGVRTLALPRRAVEILDWWSPLQKRTRMAAPRWEDHDLVVTSPVKGGHPLSNAGLRVRLRRYCERLDLPLIPPHGLRHSYASWMAALGVHPLVVQQALGHRSSKLTLDVYSHVSEGMTREAAQALDRALNAARAALVQ